MAHFALFYASASSQLEVTEELEMLALVKKVSALVGSLMGL